MDIPPSFGARLCNLGVPLRDLLTNRVPLRDFHGVFLSMNVEREKLRGETETHPPERLARPHPILFLAESLEEEA
jgi:hypothetical protein